MTSKAGGPLSLLPTPGGTGKEGDDPFVEFASHMALVHNIIIRGYNSMYLQAPKIKPADVPDFLRYCHAWYLFVVGHHDSEEKVLFPKIEEDTGVRRIMDEDTKEHGTFANRHASLSRSLSLGKNTWYKSCFSRRS